MSKIWFNVVQFSEPGKAFFQLRNSSRHGELLLALVAHLSESVMGNVR